MELNIRNIYLGYQFVQCLSLVLYFQYFHFNYRNNIIFNNYTLTRTFIMPLIMNWINIHIRFLFQFFNGLAFRFFFYFILGDDWDDLQFKFLIWDLWDANRGTVRINRDLFYGVRAKPIYSLFENCSRSWYTAIFLKNKAFHH